MSKIERFLKEEQGQDLVEYSLLLVLIAVVAVLVLTGLGTSVVSVFQRVTNTLNNIPPAQ